MELTACFTTSFTNDPYTSKRVEESEQLNFIEYFWQIVYQNDAVFIEVVEWKPNVVNHVVTGPWSVCDLRETTGQ